MKKADDFTSFRCAVCRCAHICRQASNILSDSKKVKSEGQIIGGHARHGSRMGGGCTHAYVRAGGPALRSSAWGLRMRAAGRTQAAHLHRLPSTPYRNAALELSCCRTRAPPGLPRRSSRPLLLTAPPSFLSLASHMSLS